ncbi:MAG TPA: sensor domain-containing protein [Solirubrobacteraceae bacterium]|nr:sensor domain-containing protein [Solirubrobacteraceae bacterium]
MSTAAPTPLHVRWSRDLVFHLAGVLTTNIGLALWVTGVATSLGLAITYFGLVVALGTLLACRWFARIERRRAAIVLGAPIAERYRPLDDARWTTRLHTLMGDPTTWRDFAWTGLAGIVGQTLSGLAVTLWGVVLGLVTLPAWYWALPGGADLGILDVDTLPAALGAAAAGLVLVPVAGWAARGLTVAELAWMRWLLAPRGDEDALEPALAEAAAERSDPPLAVPLALHVSFSLLIGLVVTMIWAATGFGYFWPVWVWLGLALSVALDVVMLRALAADPGPERRLRVHAELSALTGALLVILWLLAGAGTFWAFFPLLGLGVVLAVHAMVVHRDRLPLRAREQALVERVDVLTRTRRGALDVQAAELRRIERDLHDGAQARLVSLSMQLGRAEERLADQPEVAALVRGAREDAGAAIAELRDLARGIAPPVLADRGLKAAIEALGQRSAIRVSVEGDPGGRPLPVVETAAYFVVAEALTNVAKHAGGAAARVHVRPEGDRLVVEISDDGPGGADPAGGGLTGLRRRVEALDGTLTVTSPPAGGTTVRAALPCER